MRERTCHRCGIAISGVRRRYCGQCREERHREAARDWYEQNRHEVNAARRVTFGPDSGPDADMEASKVIVDYTKGGTGGPGVREFARARKESSSRFSGPPVVEFGPPATQSFEGSFFRRDRGYQSDPLWGVGAVRAPSATEPVFDRFGPNGAPPQVLHQGQLESSVPTLAARDAGVVERQRRADAHLRSQVDFTRNSG